jgi:hypothetical protein
MSPKASKPDRVQLQTPDVVGDRLKALKSCFPEAVSEGKVDFEKLRTALGDEIESRPERYSFTWAGKQDCIRLLQTPSRATLVPRPEESVRETKSPDWKTDPRQNELRKIRCGEEHFKGALGVDYRVVSSAKELP